MRLFIALDLPDSWKEQLAHVQKSIGWLAFGVKWVDPRGMHLTLKFLGDVDESQLENIKSEMSSACAAVESFPLKMKGTGVFPNPKRPRAFWAGLVSEGNLVRLQNEIEVRMNALGFPKEERDFTPHLTMARIKEPIQKERITEALLNYKIESEPVTVTEVHLMQSHLSASGARYESLYCSPLKNSR